MKKATLLTTAFFALAVLFTGAVQAQEDPPSKLEVGIQFSSITLPGQRAPEFTIGSTEAGFGGRITLNLNKNMALEAETNFFPHENFTDTSRYGTLWQGNFGVKVGKRFGKFGVFGKARPGFVSFSKALTPVGTFTFPFSNELFLLREEKRRTHFAMDLGGVLEFYPSRRLLTRIDVGDTIIHYGGDSFFPVLPGVHNESRTTHNLQLSAGIGFRLGSLPPAETTAPAAREKLQRYEVGAQFSSIGLQKIEHSQYGAFYEIRDVVTDVGFGGRFTFNLTPGFALEVQTDFYPKEIVFFINNERAGGRLLQTQAGIKAGKRFEKFGVFGKARPGVVSFSSTLKLDDSNPRILIFRETRGTYFSMDVGGVLEFYPTRRIVTRFDGGDTMIFYRGGLGSVTFPSPVPFVIVPSETIHNFQFSAGVGFRF